SSDLDLCPYAICTSLSMLFCTIVALSKKPNPTANPIVVPPSVKTMIDTAKMIFFFILFPPALIKLHKLLQKIRLVCCFLLAYIAPFYHLLVTPLHNRLRDNLAITNTL